MHAIGSIHASACSEGDTGKKIRTIDYNPAPSGVDHVDLFCGLVKKDSRGAGQGYPLVVSRKYSHSLNLCNHCRNCVKADYRPSKKHE